MHANDVSKPIVIPTAEPTMPSAGKGPHPLMNSGLKIMSSTTVMPIKISGVRESPAPRRLIERMIETITIGMEKKITRK